MAWRIEGGVAAKKLSEPKFVQVAVGQGIQLPNLSKTGSCKVELERVRQSLDFAETSNDCHVEKL